MLKKAEGHERAELLLQIAQSYSFKSGDEMVRYARMAEQEAAQLKLPLLEARAIQTQASGHFQAGHFDQALELYHRALAAGKRVQSDVVIGSSLNGIGAVNLQRGKLEEALKWLEESVPYLEKLDDSTKLAACISNISVIYYNRGDYEKALDYMYRSLHIYEEAGNDTGIGIVLNSIGAVYGRLDQNDKAMEIFERGLKVARKNNNTQLITTFLINCGEHRMRRGETDKAVEIFKEALTYARQLGNQDILAVCLNNIGEVYRNEGQYRNAMYYFKETLKLFEDMQLKPRMFVSHLNIGNTYLDMGDLKAAEIHLLKAETLAKELQNKGKQKQSAQLLSRLYEEWGQYDKALNYRKEFDHLQQELVTSETFDKISSLQAQHERESKEKQIQILQKEQEIRDLQLRRHRLMIGLVVLGLILTCLIIFVLYRRFRMNLKTNQMLANAYERMEKLARYDELTGLYNRRSASERIELEMVRMGRTWRPFSIMMIDVDDFKSINDRYGHECGDEVLKHLSRQLRQGLRMQDMPARWGGEEFLLMLPETPITGATILAEKLRRRVAETPVEYRDQTLHYTVTIGVSVYDRPGPVSEVIRQADEAMYTGKRMGKNRVSRFDQLRDG